MKLYFLILAALVISLASCNNENKKKTSEGGEVIAVDTTFTATTPKTSKDCYSYRNNKDTATLKINISGEELTGELNYNLHNKDTNTGKIAGELKGDTIIAEYMFDSEGLRSVREVVFVRKADGKIYQGFGDVIEKNGKTVFKDRSTLKFSPTIVFTKTACE